MRKTLVLVVLILFLFTAVSFAFQPSDPLINDFFAKTYERQENPVIRWIFSIFNFFKGGISGYTGFAGGGSNNSNLTIWDETDSGMPFASQTIFLDEEIIFFANFTNATNGAIINDTQANLTISNESVTGSMVFNETYNLWTAASAFTTGGTFNWFVNATSGIFSNLTANDTFTITGCVNLTNQEGDYYLNTNRTLCRDNYSISDSGAAGIIIFNSSNITLDCNNSIIFGDFTGVGIFANNTQNIKIRNCVVNNFTASIAAINSSVNITNVGIAESQIGIEILQSQNARISGCSINNTAPNGSSVMLNQTSNSSLSNCIMFNSSSTDITAVNASFINITNVTSNFNHYGVSAISIARVNNSNLKNVNVYNAEDIFGIAIGDIFGLVSATVGPEANNSVIDSVIENVSSSNMSTNLSEDFISNNSLTSIFLDLAQEGIGLGLVNQLNMRISNVRVKNVSVCVGELTSVNSSYNNIQLSRCGAGFGFAYVFDDPPDKKIIFENSSISNATFGIAVVNSALNSSSSIKNIVISNVTYAVALEDASIFGVFSRLSASNASVGVYATNSSADVTSSSLGISDPVLLANSNVTFVNVTFNNTFTSSIDDTSLFTVKWLLDVTVRDTLSSLIEGANVTAKDRFNDTAFSALTNSSGRTLQNLTEYFQNSTVTLYFTNYSINVSKEQFILPAPVKLNITNSTSLTITILSNQSLIVLSPQNATYINNNTINLTYVVLFSNTDKCWFINTTAQRINLSGCANTTFFAADGLRNISVFANDTLGNISFVKIFFTVDSVFPNITNINVSEIGNTTARINWTTSEEANSTVNYGVSAALGTKASDSSFNTTHSVALTGLSNHQAYSFNVTSCDRAGNCVTSGPNSFETERGDFQPQQLHVPEADIIIQELVASELTTTPQKASLTPGSKYIFTIDNERHEIKLKTVYKDSYVVFEISSDPKNVSLKEGETASVDINSDGRDDMKVNVVDIFLTKVTFELTRIPAPPVEGEEAPPAVEQPTAPPIIAPPEAPAAEEKPTFIGKYGAVLLASLVIVIIVLVSGGAILLRGRKAVIPAAEIKKVEKVAPKLSHMESLMQHAYSMLQEKKTDEDVKRMLDELNLDDNVIKSILFEMRTKNNRIDQLVKYTKIQFDKGKPVDEVRKTLEKAGWAKNIVQLATEE